MSVNDASKIELDDSRVVLQIVALLTDNSRGIIYECNVFIIQATVVKKRNFSYIPYKWSGKIS
jgi:hypothetical protein